MRFPLRWQTLLLNVRLAGGLFFSMINHQESALDWRAAVLIVVVFFAWRRGGNDSVSYSTSPVEQGDILQEVDATGTINAVITVQVGSQVSGVISELHADFNSHVSKGEVIAQISPALFAGAFAQAKADLENAQANVAVASANTAKAKATQAQTNADYERSVGLTTKGAVSEQALDLAKAAQELQARA